MHNEPIHVAVLASNGAAEIMFRYSKYLAFCNEARHYHIAVPNSAEPGDEVRAVAETRNLVTSQKFDLIISEWLTDTRAMQDLIYFAQVRGLPAAFIRPAHPSKIGRIIVATGHGPNLYEQIWITREISKGLGVPVDILHWTHPEDIDTHHETADNDLLEKMCLRLFDMKVNTIQCVGPDFAKAVAETLRPDDLLVIGAPSPLRLVIDFEGTLPDQLAKQIPNPLILLSSPSLDHSSLRHLLWGRLIKLNLHPRQKTSVLKSLVDNLIRYNMLPVSLKEEMLERALNREQISSTAIDCETAFPQVALPGFYGVAGTMGVFPDGIDFDSADGSPTRFVFLLVTPEGFCGEYLSILSKISKRMLDPSVRNALLTCKTAAEAIEILEPHKAFPHINGLMPRLLDNHLELKTKKSVSIS